MVHSTEWLSGASVSSAQSCQAEGGGAWPFCLDAGPEFRSVDSGAKLQETKWCPPGNAFLSSSPVQDHHTLLADGEKGSESQIREKVHSVHPLPGIYLFPSVEEKALSCKKVWTTEELKRTVAGWIFLITGAFLCTSNTQKRWKINSSFKITFESTCLREKQCCSAGEQRPRGLEATLSFGWPPWAWSPS